MVVDHPLTQTCSNPEVQQGRALNHEGHCGPSASKKPPVRVLQLLEMDENVRSYNQDVQRLEFLLLGGGPTAPGGINGGAVTEYAKREDSRSWHWRQEGARRRYGEGSLDLNDDNNQDWEQRVE